MGRDLGVTDDRAARAHPFHHRGRIESLGPGDPLEVLVDHQQPVAVHDVFTMTMEKYGSQPEAQSAIMDTVPVGWMEVAALRRAG